MSDTQLLVIETKNGHAFPDAVWTARSEADFASLVRQTYPRSDGVHDIETAEQAADFLSERGALTVQWLTRQQFDEFDPASFCQKVLKQAEGLGWYEPEAEAHE